MPMLHELGSAVRESSARDAKIARYIAHTAGNDYLPALQNETDFHVFCHLSDFPAGLFAWYDFRPGATLLEIGAGFGERTGMLVQKCAHVVAVERSLLRAKAICARYPHAQNLEVYAGAWEDIAFSGKLDYLVVVDGLETAGHGTDDLPVYAGYVKKLRELLKPDGVLLMTATNRYGLRYFCGEAEPYTGRPFAGIGHRMQGAGGHPFARNELVEIFRLADAPEVRFYYPLPDARLPQLIYTDAHLPEENIRERLIPYHFDKRTMVANERDLYRDILRNGVFPFFANAYLVECGPRAAMPDAVYAALSTDRGRARAMATVMHRDDTVTKSPIFSEGMAYAQGLLEKAERLKRFRVPMLEQCWEDGKGLRMPRIPHETLSMYLRHCVRDCPEEFVDILDRLWKVIQSSSPYVPARRNALSPDGDLPWGPVLEHASLELIPLNCFYDGAQFLFFDQEYVRDDYPAKYVLFRALYYLYIFDPGAERHVPLASLKERYGLAEIWDLCVAEETGRFLPSVRQHALYRLFYRQTQPDRHRMEANAQALMA